MALIIKTTGEQLPLIGSGKNHDLEIEQVQKAIGGWAESAPLMNGILKIGESDFNFCYCNEDGLQKQLPLNKEASKKLGYLILGDVVFCHNDKDGNSF